MIRKVLLKILLTEMRNMLKGWNEEKRLYTVDAHTTAWYLPIRHNDHPRFELHRPISFYEPLSRGLSFCHPYLIAMTMNVKWNKTGWPWVKRASNMPKHVPDHVQQQKKGGWAHRESIKTQCFTSLKSSLPQSGIHNITRSEKLV